MSGTFLLLDGFGGPAGQPCSGYRGFDDIGNGAQVTVRNDTGSVLGVGALGPGATESAGPPLVVGDNVIETFWCRFSIPPIAGLPRANFYTVEVSHRGEINYSFDTLQSNGWRVELSLG